MELEVGTLQEIGAQVGDVVRFEGPVDIGPEVKVIVTKPEYVLGGYLYGKDIAADLPNWRIISRANQGPVRTVTTTRLEIVPGDYGSISVQGVHKGKVGVCIRGMWSNDELKGITAILGYAHLTADELTAAIATLTVIRDAMKSNGTA